MAHELLRNYTREVYLATKEEGWDGKMHMRVRGDDEDEDADNDVPAEMQWTFAGSLLFSITVITTIGSRDQARHIINIVEYTAWPKKKPIPTCHQIIFKNCQNVECKTSIGVL